MKPWSKKYFADYEERAIPGGAGKKELVYNGNTWQIQFPPEKLKKRKILFIAMAAVCIALFVAITLQNVESNREGAIASISIATVIPMFVLVYGCLYSLTQKETMTKMQHMESVMLIRFGSFFTAFMGYLEGIWHIIALKGGALTENSVIEAVLACGWCAIGVVATVLWVIEMRTKYVVRNKYGGIIHQTHFKRRKSI